MQDRQLYLDGNTGIGEYKTKPVHFGYCCCLGHEYREFRLDDVSEVEDITTKKMVTRRPRRGISYQQEVTNTRVKFRFVDESSYFPDMEVSKDEVESIDRFIRDYKQGFVHNQDAHQIEMRNMQQDDYPDLAQAYPIPSNTTHAYPIPSNAPQQQYPNTKMSFKRHPDKLSLELAKSFETLSAQYDRDKRKYEDNISENVELKRQIELAENKLQLINQKFDKELHTKREIEQTSNSRASQIKRLEAKIVVSVERKGAAEKIQKLLEKVQEMKEERRLLRGELVSQQQILDEHNTTITGLQSALQSSAKKEGYSDGSIDEYKRELLRRFGERTEENKHLAVEVAEKN
ncbi:MAG: hypothetical protein EZS28_021249, partial [Streblomastix strix]